MRYWVGFDVGKAFHWLCVLDEEGEEVLSRRVEATEEDLEAACSEIEGWAGSARSGSTSWAGRPPCWRRCCSGAARGSSTCRASPSTGPATPTRARPRATPRTPTSSPTSSGSGAVRCTRSAPGTRPSAEMRVLVAHRRDLLQDQTRRAARLREVLLGVFPGLEAALDLKREGALVAVTKVATPAAARKLGAARLFRWLKARGVRKAEDLAERIVEAAKAQRRELPAAEAKAALVAEIASEILRTRERIAELDRRLEELLAQDPAARIVRSMPGMGVVFTAEFLAEVGDLGKVRLGRRACRRRRRRSRAQSVGSDELPAKGETRQQGPQARPVPLGLQLHLPPQAQRSLLQEEAGRRQGPPPGGDRLGSTGGWTYSGRCCAMGRRTASALLERLD